MIVIFTDEAEADLEHIADVIAVDSPGRADSFVSELVTRCERLADLPERFPLVPRYENTGIRRTVHGEYLIFYMIHDETVFILHVLHGRMDYQTLLFPED